MFYKYIFEMYVLVDLNEIIKNHDLNRNKDLKKRKL